MMRYDFCVLKKGAQHSLSLKNPEPLVFRFSLRESCRLGKPGMIKPVRVNHFPTFYQGFSRS